jgi:putrescine transport system permease protein
MRRNPLARMSFTNLTALALGLAFLYAPIAILVVYSFNASRLVTVWGGWSTRWYAALIEDRAMIDAALALRSPRRRLRPCSAPWRRWC